MLFAADARRSVFYKRIVVACSRLCRIQTGRGLGGKQPAPLIRTTCSRGVWCCWATAAATLFVNPTETTNRVVVVVVDYT